MRYKLQYKLNYGGYLTLRIGTHKQCYEAYKNDLTDDPVENARLKVIKYPTGI